jgi:hypothetical protein
MLGILSASPQPDNPAYYPVDLQDKSSYKEMGTPAIKHCFRPGHRRSSHWD